MIYDDPTFMLIKLLLAVGITDLQLQDLTDFRHLEKKIILLLKCH